MKITIALDVSGSIGEAQFAAMKDRMFKRFYCTSGNRFTVVLFDHSIPAVLNLDNISQIRDIPFIGHGGTDGGRMLKEIEKTMPDQVVICTDECFPYLKLDSNYEVMIFN